VVKKIVDWSEQPLGKKPDGEIAKTLGVSTNTVRCQRTSLGILPYRRGVDWDSVAHLLGTKTDKALGADFGVRFNAVAYQRTKRGIPSALSQKLAFWESKKELLGTMPDSSLGRKLGFPGYAVKQQRDRLGIAPYTRTRLKKNIDWDNEPLLGVLPDNVLSKKHGCTHTAVAAARSTRGISRATKGICWDLVWDLGVVEDAVIAERLGCSVSSVASARLRMGIPPAGRSPGCRRNSSKSNRVVRSLSLGKHGSSDATPFKQQALADLLGAYISRLASNYKRKALIVDATAGKGRARGEKGSPFVFLESLQAARLNCDFLAIEHNKNNFARLRSRVAGWKATHLGYLDHMRIELVEGDNGKTLKEVLDRTSHPGLVYMDTNWVPPFELLLEVEKINPKMRLAVSCSTTSCKREKKRKGHSDFWEDNELSDMLGMFDKRWFVNLYGEEASGPALAWHWCMLFGVPKNDPCVSVKTLKKAGYFEI